MSPATPISEAQLNANRQNAQSSTGPRSDDAKKRTRLNALRHGLTGQTIVMPYEDAGEYEDFCAATISGLNPVGDAERALAQTIANDSWRLDRARAIEENIFAVGLATSHPETATDAALNQAMTWLDHAREIDLLSLYAGRIVRAIDKNKRELNALQADRRKACDQALEEAILLAEFAESRNETYNPADDEGPGLSGPTLVNGFGFSIAQLARLIDRKRRLNAARQFAASLAQPSRKAA